jgi:hypothetical protein
MRSLTSCLSLRYAVLCSLLRTSWLYRQQWSSRLLGNVFGRVLQHQAAWHLSLTTLSLSFIHPHSSILDRAALAAVVLASTGQCLWSSAAASSRLASISDDGIATITKRINTHADTSHHRSCFPRCGAPRVSWSLLGMSASCSGVALLWNDCCTRRMACRRPPCTPDLLGWGFTAAPRVLMVVVAMLPTNLPACQPYAWQLKGRRTLRLASQASRQAVRPT